VLNKTDGKGELWIAGDPGDVVNVDHSFTRVEGVSNSAVGDGIPDAHYATFTANEGGHVVTLHIEANLAVHY
jgi:hypothetical protein